MLVTKDTQKMDSADEFGETLREYCFVPDIYGGSVGCYSTFELRPEFTPVGKDTELGVVLLAYLGHDCEYDPVEDWGVNIKEVAHLYTNGSVHVAWYWDGDGVLVFKEGDKVAYNGDCKCSYDWKWRP